MNDVLHHDSLPTNRLLVPNLSLVFTSYRQEMAIIKTTNKKIVTNRPDSTEGVMLRKSWLGVEVCCWSRRELLALLAKYITDLGYCTSKSASSEGDTVWTLLTTGLMAVSNSLTSLMKELTLLASTFAFIKIFLAASTTCSSISSISTR